ncbi:MAG: CocE/NonD family hydrolase, partial [Chloroflexota bacterium]
MAAALYRDVRVPMRDGVELATDIYLPCSAEGVPAAGPFSVILSRTPYDKGRDMGLTNTLAAVQRGFAVAVQDVRGRYGSQGAFRLMLDDGLDGTDTLAWLGRQPWSNGRIGMVGVSYLGATQMVVLPHQPPQLVSAFSEQPSSDQFTQQTFHSGALTLSNVAGWGGNAASADLLARLPERQRADAEADLKRFQALGLEAYGTLPLKEMPFLRRIPAVWADLLSHWDDPSFFTPNTVAPALTRLNIPVYHLGGWYDLFLRNTITHYEAASSTAASADARANQRLIIGPWMHGGMSQPRAGECTFPDGALDDGAYALAWHDHWLRGAAAHPAFAHPVILYVIGANRWRAEPSWPLPGTTPRAYYLHSGGRATTAAGDGTLSLEHPSAVESADAYHYDPRDPVPSLGGTIPPAAGRNDQRPLLHRRDVLVYRTLPLERDVEVTGRVRAVLYASTSATDTDWTAKLVDVHPDGSWYHVVEGIVRARYRSSRAVPRALTPGQVERYDIDMWATSTLFSAGHSIALLVSSSNFPTYDRNPNVFMDLRDTTEADFQVAEQRVHHSPEHASHLLLPIVDTTQHTNWIPNPMPHQGPP